MGFCNSLLYLSLKYVILLSFRQRDHCFKSFKHFFYQFTPREILAANKHHQTFAFKSPDLNSFPFVIVRSISLLFKVLVKVANFQSKVPQFVYPTLRCISKVPSCLILYLFNIPQTILIRFLKSIDVKVKMPFAL